MSGTSKKEDPKKTIPCLTPMEKVAIRNSWLKIGVLGSLTLVAIVKIWQADFSTVLTGFDFSDLLSLFLAMFSIALAVLFYLKATDTSNVFYDNTYRFTKDVSEILGRVEAGFGERLKHLDEGYSGLKTAVERIPFDRNEAEKEIEEEEEQVKKVEEQRNQMIEDLAKRAQLEQREKEELFERLKNSDEQLTSARRELAFMRRRMAEAEGSDIEDPIPHLPLRLQHMLRKAVRLIEPMLLHEAPLPIVSREFNSAIEDSHPELRHELRAMGILDREFDLTRQGLQVLRKVIQ